VVLAHQFALTSEHVTADMVEATEFPHLANKYNVYGVPRIVINEVIHIEGAVPEEHMIDAVMQVMDEDLMDDLRKQWEKLQH
jgi:predicted DsbA family dithiol-disulfide isomerase